MNKRYNSIILSYDEPFIHYSDLQSTSEEEEEKFEIEYYRNSILV